MTYVTYSSFPDSESERRRVQDILEAGYNDNFDAQKAAKLFERATGVVEVRRHLGKLTGIAILGDESGQGDIRLMMGRGVSHENERAFANCVFLLEVCRDEQLANWMSVGVQHSKMQSVCRDANMVALEDENRVHRLLKPLHGEHEPILSWHESGAIVARGVKNPAGQGQFVYAWPD